MDPDHLSFDCLGAGTVNLKVWWHAATLLIYFYINRAVIQYLYILLAEYPVPLLLSSLHPLDRGSLPPPPVNWWRKTAFIIEQDAVRHQLIYTLLTCFVILGFTFINLKNRPVGYRTSTVYGFTSWLDDKKLQIIRLHLILHKFTPQLFVPELVPHSCPICSINLDDGAIWVSGSFPVIFKMTNPVAICKLSSQPASCVILFEWCPVPVVCQKESLFPFWSLSLWLVVSG